MANAVTKAYDVIKAAIMSGELEAGARVKEELIAEQVGVSRTPIREALHKLTAEGFLTMPPNQGARVIEWSAQDLIEITDLRAVLESHGAGIAAQRISGADLEELDCLCGRMEEAASLGSDKELEALTNLNSRFHMTIIAASDNARLADVIGNLAHPLLVQRRFSGFGSTKLQRSMDHHREITTALRVGDSGWASAIMSAHILASRGTDL
jgi:DNA-binding GntR family transcriptional regulator